MSMWTHIVAAIDVDTCIECDDIENRIEKLLKIAPKITGSEGDADVFVNVLSGYNMYTSKDCDRCEFGNSIVHLDEGVFTCEAPVNYECPSGKYQTRAVITVIGDLRDRTRDRTKAEWMEFKKYIDKNINGRGFIIRNYAWKIIGW